jgi:hypothetical protein
MIILPIAWRSGKELLRIYRFMKNYVLEQEEPVRQNIACWVHNYLPEGVTVAAKEIDQLAFYSKPGQRVLSMDGTVGGEVLPYLPGKKLTDFLYAYRPSHLLVEGNIYQSYPYWRSTEISRLAENRSCQDLSDNFSINGLEFSLLHEKSFFPYIDLSGNLRQKRCAWRIFSITYPD